MESLRMFFNSISRWSVVGLALLLPVFFLPGGFVTIFQGKLAIASVAVLLAVFFTFVASVLAGGVRMPRSPVFFIAALLPLAYIASTLTAGWSPSSVVSGLAEQDTVVTVALLFGIFAATALVVSREPYIVITIIRAIVVSIFVLVLFQIARLFFPDALSFNGALPNTTATVAGSWHDLGTILGCAVILCGTLFRTRFAGQGLWRILFGATAVLSFLFLIIISMQDVWFVLASVSGIFGVYAYFAAGSEGATPRTRGIRAALWIVVALLAFLFGWFNVWVHDRLPDNMRIVVVEVRPSWEGTLSVGQSSLSDSRALLFGTGPNSFARNWAQHKPEGVNSTLFWNLDFASGVGAVPTSFVTIGALGIAAWALLILAFFWAVGRALSATRMFDATQTTVFSLACAVAFLFAFHVMYAPGIAVSALLFLLLGLFIALPLSEEVQSTFIAPFSFENVGRFLSFVAVGLTACALVLASVVSLQALTSDVLVNRSILLYNQSGNMPASEALVQQALRVWSSNDRAHRAAVELGILELGRLAANAANDTNAAAELQSKLSATIDHGLTAVSIDRVDYQNWLTLAFLYQELAGVGVAGAYEQAQAAYTSARAENPTNPLPLFRLAQLEVARGNRAEALKNLDAALALKVDFAPAHFLRSQLLAQDGKLQDAVASAAAVVQLVPEDPLAWYNLGVILYTGRSYNEAGAAFVQAVTLQGDYSNAIFMLGLSFFQVGQSEQAIATFTRVAELNPTDTTVPAMIRNVRAGKDPFDGLAQQ